MQNWKVITALILFFPLGLYWMFKHTDWPDKVKWVISAFFAVPVSITLLSESFYTLLAIFAFILTTLSIVWFVYSIIRRKQKRNSVIALLFGIILFAYSANTIGEQAAEAERIAQEEQLERERISEEERLEQERIEEEKRLEEERKIAEEKLEVATLSVEKLESEPTMKNYESAKELVDDLADPDDDLESRLSSGLVLVEEYEAALAEASEAVDAAEQDMSRESYEKATALASSLAIADKDLTTRLNTVEESIVKAEQKAEEERLAKEKAEKEEAERIAKEKAEQEKAAQEKAAAEQAKANASSSNSSSQNTNKAPAQIPPPADTVAKVVYIAPQSGTKYHYDPNCRGLSNANSVKEISITDAKNQGYDLCGWED